MPVKNNQTNIVKASTGSVNAKIYVSSIQVYPSGGTPPPTAFLPHMIWGSVT